MEIQIFNNDQFGQIRCLEKDGQPWFVGKDVAEVLGYANPSKAIIVHVDEEDKQCEMLEATSQNGNLLNKQEPTLSTSPASTPSSSLRNSHRPASSSIG